MLVNIYYIQELKAQANMRVNIVMDLTKVLLEEISRQPDPDYLMNFGRLFAVTYFATFVLFLHRIFHKIPLLYVMIGQYAVIMSIVFLGIYLADKLTDVSVHANRDIFLQITVPYLIFAGIYYLSYFNEVKKANHNLNELKKGRWKIKPDIKFTPLFLPQHLTNIFSSKVLFYCPFGKEITAAKNHQRSSKITRNFYFRFVLHHHT